MDKRKEEMEGVRTVDQINSELQIMQGRLDGLNQAFNENGFGTSQLQQPQILLLRNDYTLRVELLNAEKDVIGQYAKVFTDCIKLDKHIKLLDIDIASKSKERLSAQGSRVDYLERFVSIANVVRSKLQVQFVNQDCKIELEMKPEAELSSGKKSKQLFIISAVVLLVALGIILYSKKKK